MLTRSLTKRSFLLALAMFAVTAHTASAQADAAAPTPVTITVEPGARQTFGGFGASLLNFNGDYQKLTPIERQKLSEMFWRRLNFKILRLWFNADQYAPTPDAHDLTEFRRCYVDSGIIADAKRNGVTTLLLAPDHLPAYMTETSAERGSSGSHQALKLSATDAYATLVAEFIDRLKKETGVKIDVTGVHNEPNDTFRFDPAQIVAVVKRLRSELDKRGLKSVKIIAPENASVNDVLYAQVDALKADPEAWRDLAGIASHSYNMAATPEIARRVAGTGKSYWMTEASDNGPEAPGDALRAISLCARFLNDMNHGVTHWIHFVGFETPDANDNATRILAYTPSPFSVRVFAKYASYRQLSETFDVGAVFRHCVSATEGEMIYNYGKKPRVNVAVARNPDGTCAIGVSNDTSPTFSDADDEHDFALHNSGHAAQTYAVTINVPELASRGTLPFRCHFLNMGKNTESSVTMVNGVLTLPKVEPLALITLREYQRQQKK